MLNSKFEIREITIVLLAQNHNPTILNPDFLRYNNVVPRNWQLKEPPICAEPIAQVTFDNEIKITAQLDKVIFYEPITKGMDFVGISIAEIADKYINILPHVKYTAVGVNPKGHIIFDSTENAQKFIFNHFIKSGPWQKYEKQLTNASINLSYKFEQSILSFTINPSMFKESDMTPVPVVLFSANFHHEIKKQTLEPKERLDIVSQIVREWHLDIDIYKRFINELPD